MKCLKSLMTVISGKPLHVGMAVAMLSSACSGYDARGQEEVGANRAAVTHAESGDSGNLPGTAQQATGSGSFTNITGGFASVTDVDMYKICLTGGGTFSADTTGTGVDTQLFLFDAAGLGVYHNDDITNSNTRSRLPSGHTLTPSAAGIYYLAISTYDVDPAASGSRIFPNPAGTSIAGPTGPGGANAVTGWVGAGSGGVLPYTIALTGAAFCVQPPDLSATLVESADPVALGGTYTYTLTVANNGAGDSTDVLASTTLSGAAHTILSATASQGSCTITGSDVDCDLDDLAASQQATVTITVEPEATGTITANSSVTANEADANASDDTDSESTTINNANGCTIVGTSGNDTINGTSGADVICGLGGNDTIDGGNGADVIYGGSGDDTMAGGNSDDTIYGGLGDDILNGENGNDTLYGQEGDDESYGEDFLAGLLGLLFDNGNDTIYGGPGNDVLDGQNGDDTLIDHDGTDTMNGGNGADTIDVQDSVGGDTANGGLGSDTCLVDGSDSSSGC